MYNQCERFKLNFIFAKNPNPAPNGRHEAPPNAPKGPKLASPAPYAPSRQSLDALNGQSRHQLKVLARMQAEELTIENQKLRQSKEPHLLAKSQRGDELRRLQVELDQISGQMRSLELRHTAATDQQRQILAASQSDEAMLKDIDDRISKNDRGIEIFLEAASF